MLSQAWAWRGPLRIRPAIPGVLMTASSSDSGRSVVGLEPVRGDVREAVRRALDAVEWRKVVPRGAPVALKVNLGWDLFIPGSITSPLVAESLILELQEHVGKLYMVEANQVLEDVESAYRRSGMAEVCRRTGVEWVNMSRAPTVPVSFPENVVLRKIEVPAILREALLISVPVMKTHAKTVISGALKNQWGCLPEMRHEYHLVLDDALADLNLALRPVLSLMDGTIGLEGNGPKSGRPRVADRILCSTDPVALDTIQAICMGLDPSTVIHLARCAERGIGTNQREQIDVRGLVPEEHQVAFKPPRHNTVSVVETLLRRSRVKRWVFNTPFFGLCLRGAKLYYKIWTAFNARRCWAIALDHPTYGPQWLPPDTQAKSGR
jgi:uncharacterized protein (DUF362 family)